MEDYKKIVLLSGIDSDITNILIQRLIYRLNRVIKPDLTIIITDKIIPKDSMVILETLKYPLITVSDIKETLLPELYSVDLPIFSLAPFSYLVIENIDRPDIKVCHLAMDKNLNLVDNHIHTQLAYCSDNMDLEKTISLAKIFGLKSIRITEHSGQLYYNSQDFSKVDSYIHGIGSAMDIDRRMDEYLDFKRKYSSNFVQFGLEVDCDFNGNFILKEEDKKHFDFILGSMHRLQEINAKEFILLLDKLLKKDIDVLAHPFRIFKRNGKVVPVELFKPTAKLLKEYNTAAEINFHTNEPPVDFIRECLEVGVKFSLGSDSHNMAEIGDFSYHLSLFDDIGFSGELSDILWDK